MIYIIRNKATPDQIKDMLEMLQTYIKLAVDIDRRILAGDEFRAHQIFLSK